LTTVPRHIMTPDTTTNVRNPIMGGEYMGGSIQYHKPARRYYIQVYWEGKYYKIWKHPVSGDPFFSKRTAEKQLMHLRVQVDNNEFNPTHWMPENPILMKYCAYEWLEDKRVTPKTLTGYKTALDKYIVPRFKNKDVRRLGARDIRKFKEHLDTILSPKGVYNTMGVLKTMLRDLYRDEIIPRVPPFPPLTQGEVKKPDNLTIEEQDTQLSVIPERDRPVFAFGMEYGLRVGEVRAIQKDCITSTHVTIKRAFSDNRLKGTKTGLEREYVLTDYALDVLSQVEPHLGQFLFVRKDGKPYTNKNLNKIWREASAQTGIKIKLYNAMRHSLGCQLVDEGHDLDLVRQQLGHTDIRTTKRYATRNETTLKSALEGRRAKVIPLSQPLNNL